MHKLISFNNLHIPFIYSGLDRDLLPTGNMFVDSSHELNSSKFNLNVRKTILQRVVNQPIMVLNIIEEHNLPLLEIGHFKENALISLIKRYTEEHAYEDKEKMEVALQAHKKEQSRLEKEWKQDLDTLNTTLFKAIFAEEHDSQLEESIWKQLHKLHSKKSNSLLPFFRFSKLFLYSGYDTVSYIVKQAHDIDPAKTYTTFVSLYRAAHISMEEEKFSLFQLFNSPHLLPVLRAHYPRDWLLIRFESTETDRSLIDKSDTHLYAFKTYMKQGITSLIKGDYDNAQTHFVTAKLFAVGDQSSYIYLALSWLMKGDLPKALSILITSKHVKSVIHFPTLSQTMPIALKQSLGIPIETPKQTPTKEEELVSEFLKMHRKSDEKALTLSDVTELMNYSAYTLSYERNTLPIVYIILKWIESKSIQTPDHVDSESYSENMNHILRLMNISQQHCINPTQIAPELEHILEHNEEDPPQLLVHGFQHVFKPKNLLKEEKTQPVISFHEQRFVTDLTDESAHSFAVEICLLAHRLFTSYLIPETYFSLLEDETLDKTYLPDNPQFMSILLQKGIQSGIHHKDRSKPGYLTGLSYLESYLSIHSDTPGYVLDSTLVEWATFATTTVSPQSILEKREWTSLKKELDDIIETEHKKAIKDCYKTVTALIAQRNESKTLLMPSDNSRHAIKHALHAVTNRVRSIENIELDRNTTSIWSIVELGQSLFGWRATETFEEWGQRLETAIIPTLSLGDSFDTTGNKPEGEAISISITGIEYLDVLNAYQTFWKQFHKDTMDKNNAITNGAADDTTTKELIPTKWCNNNKPLWLSMIDTNNPTLHPKFSTFSAAKQRNVTTLVAEKHRHNKEVDCLKQVWEKALKKLPKDLWASECASLLVENTKENKGDVFVSLYVENHQLAESIYRILLETSIRAVIATDIMVAGPSIWKLKSVPEWISFIQSSFKKLSGTFHGPETHLNGAGPLQIHYNAGVYHGGKPINTHIYFPSL